MIGPGDSRSSRRKSKLANTGNRYVIRGETVGI